MSFISNTIVAFSMSADAFAISVNKDITLHRPKIKHAFKIGLIFGGIETLTPIIGWGLGMMANKSIAFIDHWLAFTILSLIGGKMIYETFHDELITSKRSHKFWLLILTALGTSIDALAIGATLTLLNVNIWMMAGMIGIATFIMVTIGIMTGHYLGTKTGKATEFLGEVCLIAIGAKILIEHLTL
ncbi:MAG: manganese efflux pump MntP family protein [Alphaproteobacteria bacterium]|nr:manganese efflux pump MntP family protein [Alphaproteobacteria bacterium]